MRDETGHVTKERRDEIDWRMWAPRWLLVLGMLGFCGLLLKDLRGFVDRDETQERRINALEKAAAESVRTNKQLREQGAQLRVDTLRWQLHSSVRNRDAAFADDLRDRLRDAERALAVMRHEPINGNGTP